jgi:hypothetical protein
LRKVFVLFQILVLLLVFITPFSRLSFSAQAQEENPEDEVYIRTTTITVEYTSHEWWLVRWKGDEITCRFMVDHEGLPTADEVKTWCGDSLEKEWLNTKPCNTENYGGDVQKCPGLYMNYFQSYPGTREVEVELPLPQVWLALDNCELVSPENTCDHLPGLMFIGEESLANEGIIRIQGSIDGEPFSCAGDICSVPIGSTGPNGVEVQFWADSSFGDSSQIFSALVRIMPWGDFMEPEGSGADQELWYVDVISDQWRGTQVASCTETWQVFPNVGGPAPWLLTPQEPKDLYTTVSFYYLAGMLINSNEVDAGYCPNDGMQTGITANSCGVQAAYDKVLEWQNHFDEEIFDASLETGVPAQLLKNVFSRESQFWPGIYSTYQEAGLGQLTENGADTVLLWNPSFFYQFCPLVLGQDRCDLGFGNISAEEQAMLRGALVQKVNSTCQDCPVGIDLSQANFSVRIFAEGLIANCEQVGQIIRNVTGNDPGNVSSYEDLWRYTLVNYNAGSGCLGDAITQSIRQSPFLNWDLVASHLSEGCQGAIAYVEDISVAESGLEPTPTSWVQFGTPSGAQLTAIATQQATPIPGGGSPTPTSRSTPMPTPTSGGYPPYPTPTQAGYPPQPTPTSPGNGYP